MSRPARKRVSDAWTLRRVESGAGGLGDHVPDEAPPPQAVRESVAEGTLVALIFQREGADQQGQYERLWVAVTEAGAGDTYAGVLENQPTFIRGLDVETTVRFDPGHIFGVMQPKRW